MTAEVETTGAMGGTEPQGSDDRLIRETGVDARVAAIVTPVLDAAGYRLVRVRLSGQNGLTLQIMAERLDGTMTVEDCEAVSRAVSPALDVEDPITGQYHLEVSSPGIDRPLVRVADFERWQGHVMKLETSVMVEGRKRFRGKVVATDANGIVFERDQLGYGEEPTARIPWDTIADARLILTDDLIEMSLKQDKKARQERKKRGRKGGAGEDAETDIDEAADAAPSED